MQVRVTQLGWIPNDVDAYEVFAVLHEQKYCKVEVINNQFYIIKTNLNQVA